MARAREFDPEQAVEQAMRLFWRQGYAGTSTRELVRRTGVAHAGLYGAFGDKRGLYQAALERYGRVFGAWLLVDLERPDSARAEVERFFEMLVDAAWSRRFGDGCFLCNAAVEFGDSDGAVRDAVHAHVERLVAAFEGALGRARERAEVDATLDPRAGAEFLAGVFQGVAVLARARGRPRRIQGIVATALERLG